jgi:uncharacterized repeat protein (TIGR03803 family)
MTKLNGWKMAGAVLVLCALTAIAAPAQTFTKLFNLGGWQTGSNPDAALVQGSDGNLYGTTSESGYNRGDGTIFEIILGSNDMLTTLYSFCTLGNCPDGDLPEGPLTLGSGGSFYGTTLGGGAYHNGTVFKITPKGALTTLYSFCAQANCIDGVEPGAALVIGTDGNFYGSTQAGGANGGGTIFRMTPGGELTTLHSFCDQNDCPYGVGSRSGLIQATDGNFYGTTQYGGVPRGAGTIFKITAQGHLTTLYTFCTQSPCTDGAQPLGGLVQASDGNFYGTTSEGGIYSFDCEYGCGTVFKITPQGALTTLYSFDDSNGNGPIGTLVQATDGNLYGTTGGGGSTNGGTIFEITLAGALTTLYNFCSDPPNCPDGAGPAGLLQATDGNFYGTTFGGGNNNCNTGETCGTVYQISMGFGPFVSLPRSSGKIGVQAFVLGQGLTGTTNVSFNGTAANFVVGADTYLTTRVPAGAPTGAVTVTTPSGTLTSNVPFRITPQLLSFSPPSGPVGTVVTITGVSLTQTVGVGFGDDVPANFTVNSDLQVTATVPSGAKTGKVGVQTQGGTAISTAVFTVTP